MLGIVLGTGDKIMNEIVAVSVLRKLSFKENTDIIKQKLKAIKELQVYRMLQKCKSPQA